MAATKGPGRVLGAGRSLPASPGVTGTGGGRRDRTGRWQGFVCFCVCLLFFVLYFGMALPGREPERPARLLPGERPDLRKSSRPSNT